MTDHYNNRPLVTETDTVLDCLAEMVRRVKERAEQMGLAPSTRFVFKMSPELWGEVSKRCAYRTSEIITSAIPIIETSWKWAKLRAKLSIFVDGIEYPVELDKDCGVDIFFMAKPEPSWPRRLLTAILVGGDIPV